MKAVYRDAYEEVVIVEMIVIMVMQSSTDSPVKINR